MICYACGRGITEFCDIVGLGDDGEVSVEGVALGTTCEPDAGWYPLCNDCGCEPGGKLSGPAILGEIDGSGNMVVHERIPADPEYETLRARLYTRLHTQGGVRLAD